MDLLTVHETAAMLKLNPKTVRHYISTGRLPAIRIGRRVRIEQAAVQALAQPYFSPFFSKEVSKEVSRETTSMHGGIPVPADVLPGKRLTPDEQAEQLASVADAEAFAERIQVRRGGALLPESWSFIREAHEERSTEL